MIFKYDTQNIGDKHYLRGIRLISEKGTPDYILEDDNSLAIELIDENRKLQYECVDNLDYDSEVGAQKDNRPYLFIKSPQALSAEEEAQKTELLRISSIRSAIHIEDIVDALISFRKGDPSKIDAMETLLNQ